MAERLVLASLTIDEKGVVSGLAAIDSGLKTTQTQSDETGRRTQRLGGFINQLVGNMFSLRRIANVVLGGFTVAGAIQGLKALISAVFTSDLHFAAFKATLDEFQATAVRGIGTLIGVPDLLDRMKTSLISLNALFDFMSKLEIPPIVKAFITVASPLVAAFKGAGLVVDAFNRVIQEVLPAETAAAQRAAELREAFTFSGLTLPEDLKKNIGEAAISLRILRREYQDGSLDAGRFSRATENIVSILLKQGSVTLGVQTAIDALTLSQATLGIDAERNLFRLIDAYDRLRASIVAAGATAAQLLQFDRAARSVLVVKTQLEGLGVTQAGYNEALRVTNQGLEGQKVAFESIGIALGTVGSSLANLIIQGGKGKDLFANILKSIAQAMFVMAAQYTAYAIAATTLVGAATLGGTPAQFLKAAALFAGVGALAALGARAVGGGGQQQASGAGGASQPGGLGPGLAPERRQPATNLTVIVQGNVIGQEQYVRELVVDVQRALLAGAGGGAI